MFKCELCDKEVKHTRNIIGAHMKMVHLISWKEYQEILVKLRQVRTRIKALKSGFIFVRTISVQNGKCSPFLKLTPTL